MDPLQTGILTRAQIGDFIKSDRGIRAFEAAQSDITNQYEVLTSGTFLTLAPEPTLGSERILTPVPGEIVGADGGANNPYTLGLADTTVAPDTYGDDGGVGAAHFVSITVDAKGRATSASTFTITTTNVPEGGNLYFTDARSRGAVSAGAGINYNSSTGVVSAKPAGAYGTPTGTLSRASFASYTAGATLTFSASYVQAELNTAATRIAAVEAALQNVSRTLAALITDMEANGNLT